LIVTWVAPAGIFRLLVEVPSQLKVRTVGRDPAELGPATPAIVSPAAASTITARRTIRVEVVVLRMALPSLNSGRTPEVPRIL
jgi:hypothetical protein